MCPSVSPDISTEGASDARAALEHSVRCARGESSRVALARPVVRDDLRGLGPGELRTCMDRVLLARHADAGLDALFATGVLAAALPEVHALVGFGDYAWRHKDVWRHTKQVVIQSVPRLPVRWAALLHDIGKPRTRRIDPEGEVSFIGHPELGARLFDRIERREKLFRADPELRDTIRFLILHHQRAGQYEDTWTDSAVRRFARELAPHLDELFLLARADMTTKHRHKKRRMMFAIKAFQDRIARLLWEDAKVPPLPSGIGDAIMLAFGLRPSRLIGEIKRALEERVESGVLPRQAEASVYLTHIAEHRQDFGLE